MRPWSRWTSSPSPSCLPDEHRGGQHGLSGPLLHQQQRGDNTSIHPLPTVLHFRCQPAEGNLGTHGLAFTVSLSATSLFTTTVDFLTFDGTARAEMDYWATTGTVVFLPGVTSQTVTVPIVGDLKQEDDETFTVLLQNPSFTTVMKRDGLGTIVNDDRLPGQVDHFDWGPIGPLQLDNRPFVTGIRRRMPMGRRSPISAAHSTSAAISATGSAATSTSRATPSRRGSA